MNLIIEKGNHIKHIEVETNQEIREQVFGSEAKKIKSITYVFKENIETNPISAILIKDVESMIIKF